MTYIGVLPYLLYEGTVADKCPKCNNISEIEISIYQKIFFLIFPFVSINKYSEVKCNKCKNNLNLKDAPDFVVQKYNQEIKKVKTPIWSFGGSIFISCALILMAIIQPIFDRQNTQLILAPKIGDTYKIRLIEEGILFDMEKYTLLKVADISENEITFQTCLFEVDEINEVSKLLDKPDDELWLDEKRKFTKSKLIQMLDYDAKIHIIDINRHSSN